MLSYKSLYYMILFTLKYSNILHSRSVRVVFSLGRVGLKPPLRVNLIKTSDLPGGRSVLSSVNLPHPLLLHSFRQTPLPPPPFTPFCVIYRRVRNPFSLPSTFWFLAAESYLSTTVFVVKLLQALYNLLQTRNKHCQ